MMDIIFLCKTISQTMFMLIYAFDEIGCDSCVKSPVTFIAKYVYVKQLHFLKLYFFAMSFTKVINSYNKPIRKCQ